MCLRKTSRDTRALSRWERQRNVSTKGPSLLTSEGETCHRSFSFVGVLQENAMYLTRFGARDPSLDMTATRDV